MLWHRPVAAGPVLAIVGASGCGKSTLLCMIAGLERPDIGDIRITRARARRPGLDRCLVFQEPRLLAWLTAAENVALALRNTKLGKAEKRARVATLLEDEALLAARDLGADRFDIVCPSISVKAEPPVAVVDSVAAKHGTQAVAEAYLKFLFTQQGQEIGAKHYVRPQDQAVTARYTGSRSDRREVIG